MAADERANEDLGTLADRARRALSRADLDAMMELLAPDARWGAPEGPSDWDCKNREEVLSWWSGAQAAGVRARVTEMVPGDGTLLVGLEVTGLEDGTSAELRWQVWTIRGDRVVDIRGFDDRGAAAERAGLNQPTH